MKKRSYEDNDIIDKSKRYVGALIADSTVVVHGYMLFNNNKFIGLLNDENKLCYVDEKTLKIE